MASLFDKGALFFLGSSAVTPILLACLDAGKDPSPSTPAIQCARLDSPAVLSPKALSLLQHDGIVVLTDCIPSSMLSSARLAAKNLLNDKKMTPNHGISREVRSDLLTWVQSDSSVRGEDAEKDASLEQCARLLCGLAFELDRSRDFYRSTEHRAPLELQLSCYNGGQPFYKAHRDAPSTGPSSSIWTLGLLGWLSARPYRRRCITAILYFNDVEWDSNQAADGGALKVFIGADDDDEKGTSAKRVLSISPSGGTLVLFDSQKILHEQNNFENK